MSEKMELDAGRLEAAGETKEQEELRSLDDATYEPSEAVERTGDYREAEAIQAALTSVVETAGEAPGASPLPIPRPEDAVEHGKPPEDAAEVELDGKGERPSSVVSLDGKGERPSSVVSLDGKGNDLAAGKTGEVALDSPQAAIHEKGASSPAFTLDGKGADRSPDSDGKTPLTTTRTPERSGAHGQDDSTAEAKDADDDESELMFQIQEATNRNTNSNKSSASAKKKGDDTKDKVTQNYK